jgi:FHS family L-fucose permease-like MFS transporter
VKYVYLVIGAIVFLVAIMFMRTALPEIKEEKLVSNIQQDVKPLFSHRNFTGAIIAQFFYVAAQVGVAALFINYCTEASSSITNSQASYFLSVSLMLFTLGRFAGTALMKKIAPNRLLTIYSVINVLLCVVVFTGKGMLSVYSLMAVFFFESIMFPTIFALGVKNLGHNTKKGASFIIMSIVGGALMPYIMGMLSEKGTAHAYIVPLFCFVVVAWYGWKGYKTN